MSQKQNKKAKQIKKNKKQKTLAAFFKKGDRDKE
jgi:hypothetical protein